MQLYLQNEDTLEGVFIKSSNESSMRKNSRLKLCLLINADRPNTAL